MQIAAHNGVFAFTFLALFAVTFGFLYVVGATPNPAGAAASDFSATTPVGMEPTVRVGSANIASQYTSSSLPVRVVIKEIGLDTVVQNPTSVDIEVLDQATLLGAVRYPTSASLGEDGTVLLFGHSSYLPVVHNRVYKTFNGIQDLKKGSIVSVYSGNAEYRYSVVGIEIANATRDVVELKQNGKHLTLVTCNSFATKQNRFVVTADLVGTYSLTTR